MNQDTLKVWGEGTDAATEQHLYQIYSKWTGELHFWTVQKLGLHLDCEYFPNEYLFKVYSGFAEEFSTTSGIPGLSRPPHELSETIRLLRPEDHPTRQQIGELFKQICLAAARVLEIDISKTKLGGKPDDETKENPDNDVQRLKIGHLKLQIEE